MRVHDGGTSLHRGRKEFADQITGWRFLVILALFLVVALAGTYSGVVSYERELDRYSQQLAAMDDRFDGPERMMPVKPPVEGIYSSMFLTPVSYGGLLAIAVGFDLVSGEKESRSLKSHHSHPVYRDEIINGKALGGIALLALVVGGYSSSPPPSSSSSRSYPPPTASGRS
ncbi:ABC transporter permease subunit [Methanoculleus sp.]|uniref:ABC transporter permease n=1 Tax=Methanoculleus sp. TaxID=90427 RepID=UPI00344DCAAF